MEYKRDSLIPKGVLFKSVPFDSISRIKKHCFSGSLQTCPHSDVPPVAAVDMFHWIHKHSGLT